MSRDCLIYGIYPSLFEVISTCHFIMHCGGWSLRMVFGLGWFTQTACLRCTETHMIRSTSLWQDDATVHIIERLTAL
jgi:hypothetical protein